MPSYRQLLRWHVWLGWIVVVPLLLWTASGLFMTLFPIDQVRGVALKAEPAQLAPGTPLVAPHVDVPIDQIALYPRVDRPVWIIRYGKTVMVRDAQHDGVVPHVDAALAKRIAHAALKSPASIVGADHFNADHAPIALRKDRPSWRIMFSDGVHVFVDADSGEVLAVRSALWRTYDFMWGLHIMDPRTRENTSHWLLQGSAGVALLSIILGGWILIRRQRRT